MWWDRIIDVVDIIAGVFSVVALIFTLYLWSLDHLSEDESKFIENKRENVRKLTEIASRIAQPGIMYMELEDLVTQVNDILCVLVNYRFWVNTENGSFCEKMRSFYEDSRYFISELHRIGEVYDRKQNRTMEGHPSVVSIGSDDDDERKLLIDMKNKYVKTLWEIIDFLEGMD